MPRILHISDLHCGPPFVARVGDALLESAHEIAAEVIVASGDFTQRARPEQFQQAREFLDSLPDVPKVVVPGNHDVPLYRFHHRMLHPFQLYQEFISEELDSVIGVEGLFIVALNSTAPYQAIVNGRISQGQLEFCERAFAAAPPGAARIVVAHHHFAPAPDYEGGQVMPKAKRALDCFTSVKVEMILGGHLHRAYVGNSLDVYAGADREHGIIIVQSGTSTSRRGRAREREKNSFNLIEVTDRTIRVTHYMFFDAVGRFAPTSRHLFPRAGQGYFQEGNGAPAKVAAGKKADSPA